MSTPTRLIVLIPVYEDWDGARSLLALLDVELSRASLRARIVIVDDGYPTSIPANFASAPLNANRWSGPGAAPQHGS